MCAGVRVRGKYGCRAIMRSGPLGNYCAALWLTGSDDALDVGTEVKVSH